MEGSVHPLFCMTGFFTTVNSHGDRTIGLPPACHSPKQHGLCREGLDTYPPLHIQVELVPRGAPRPLLTNPTSQ